MNLVVILLILFKFSKPTCVMYLVLYVSLSYEGEVIEVVKVTCFWSEKETGVRIGLSAIKSVHRGFCTTFSIAALKMGCYGGPESVSLGKSEIAMYRYG